jgi:hypothetical protein
MSIWKLIIETYSALPEADRTSSKVYSQLRQRGHSVSISQVRSVLSATILSEVISEDDVRVTARTLNTLIDIYSDPDISLEPSRRNMEFAGKFTDLLWSAGVSGREFKQALLRVIAECKGDESWEQQLDYEEYQQELRHWSKNRNPF